MSNYTTYLRWGVLAGVFLVLFTPFIIASGGIIPNLFFPFITGKNFAFRILVELTLLLYVLLAFVEPKYRPRASWIMWAALALVVWLGISTLTSVDPIKSFWSNFERMDGYINILHLFAWFVITGAVLTADNLWERFMDVSIFAGALMGIDAVLQLMHVVAISSQSGPRVDTTFGNATYLAVYMLFNIFITLFMLARRSGKGGLSVGLQSAYGIAGAAVCRALLYRDARRAARRYRRAGRRRHLDSHLRRRPAPQNPAALGVVCARCARHPGCRLYRRARDLVCAKLFGAPPLGLYLAQRPHRAVAPALYLADGR